MDSLLRDWASLPVHILDLVLAKLGPLSDYVRYCAVCSQWRDSAFEADVTRKEYMNILKQSQRKLPMLMITTWEANNNKKRGLYSVSDRVTYNVDLPVGYKNMFIGSSHGWLVCIEKNLIITLINPFTNSCISLPPLGNSEQVFGEKYNGHIWEHYVYKVILTADPLKNPNGYAVLAIYSGIHSLAVYKSDNGSWDYNILPENGCTLEDIVSYKGSVYGVALGYWLLQIDINTGICTTIIDARSCYDTDNFYLVESQEGDLLLVRRVWDPCAYAEEEVEVKGPKKTVELKVLKFELDSWVEIDNIGDQILFLGVNRSISISRADFPKCKPNSIYYTDERHGKDPPYRCQGVDEDNGIYTLEDQNFYSLSDSFECIQPSIWFVPNPE